MVQQKEQGNLIEGGKDTSEKLITSGSLLGKLIKVCNYLQLHVMSYPVDFYSAVNWGFPTASIQLPQHKYFAMPVFILCTTFSGYGYHLSM